MSDEEINALIEKAKEFSNFSFAAVSSTAQGACVLTDENILIGGCNVESLDLACSEDAVSVAILKAVSEGQTKIKAIAIYSTGKNLPYLTTKARSLVYAFGKNSEVIVANDLKKETFKAFELLPFAFEGDD